MTVAQVEGLSQCSLFPSAPGLSQPFNQNKCPSSIHYLVWGSIISSNGKDAIELVHKAVLH